jgi:Opioid growth factor receptor (OGFr) conserved region
MLAFYGLRLIEHDGTPAILRAGNWMDRSRVWLRPGNHNFLRLTRIMRSLTLLGQPQLARALFDALAEEYDQAAIVIGARTLGFWKAAVPD